MLKIKHFEVVLKISERCNLNCSYCYIFNMGSELALNSAPVISNNTIIELKSFLERVAEEVEHNVIQVDLHGGEPLMLKKNDLFIFAKLFVQETIKGLSFVLGYRLMLH